MRLVITLLFLMPIIGIGQQDPNLSSEGFTPFWSNPASYGIRNNLSTHLIGKLQWTGISGAPRIFMTNTEAYVHIGPSQNDSKLSIGSGIMYMTHVAGFQRTQLFKVPINVITKLGECDLGVAVGLGYQKISFNANWVPPSTTVDPLLPSSTAQAKFDMDVGLFLNHEKFYIGLSSTHLLKPTFNEVNFSSARHYYLQAGYRFKVGQHYIFPQLNLKSDGAGLAYWNINYFQFKEDVFSIGTGFSAGRELLLAATFRYKRFKIAYNFDLNFGPLSSYTTGSHEVRLSFALPKGKKTIAETLN